MGDAPLRHVRRAPLPWQAQSVLTECGRPAGDGGELSWDELRAFIAEHGKQRASLFVCMTCWGAASRWALAPLGGPLSHAVRRAVEREAGVEGSLLEVELEAVRVLVEAHREEFDGLLAAAAGVPRLDVERRRRGYR